MQGINLIERYQQFILNKNRGKPFEGKIQQYHSQSFTKEIRISLTEKESNVLSFMYIDLLASNKITALMYP